MEHASSKFVRKYPIKRGLVFVIMPFSGDLKPIYELVIKPFITDILKMECLRADEIYSDRTVMQDIWENIQRAEIVLADLTDRNPNVMYELGFCHVLWKKTILITQKIDDVPFDLKGYRLIPYEPSIGGAERLKEGLKLTIEALRREPIQEGQIVLFEQEDEGLPLPRTEATVEAIAKDYLSLRLKDGRKAQMDGEEVSWTNKIRDLSSKFKVGDKVEGVLLSETTAPVIFSIRHKYPDPWPDFKKEFPVGKTFVGRIMNENQFGLFIEIKKYFHGLIPRRGLPPKENFNIGQEVEAAIKNIDFDRKNILLEYRGRVKDKWIVDIEKYKIGENYPGKVVTVKDTYALIELDSGLKCIAHASNFPKEISTQIKDKFPVGCEAQWKIISIDKDKRQVQLGPVLS